MAEPELKNLRPKDADAQHQHPTRAPSSPAKKNYEENLGGAEPHQNLGSQFMKIGGVSVSAQHPPGKSCLHEHRHHIHDYEDAKPFDHCRSIALPTAIKTDGHRDL